MRLHPRLASSLVVLASVAGSLVLAPEARGLGVFEIWSPPRVECDPNTTSAVDKDGVVIATSRVAAIDCAQAYTDLVQSPATSTHVDDGELASRETTWTIRTARQKELLTLTLSGPSSSVFDGRFLMARDLIRESQTISLVATSGARFSYGLYRGGVVVAAGDMDSSAAPFAVGAALESDRVAIESDGRAETTVITLDRGGDLVNAWFLDGRRVEFDALEIRVPLEAGGVHEVGHVVTLRHDHVRGPAQVSFRLAE